MRLICRVCGIENIGLKDDRLVCGSCGCSFSLEEARKRIEEGSIVPTKDDGIPELRRLMHESRKMGATDQAVSRCKDILCIDPTDWEANYNLTALKYWRGRNLTGSSSDQRAMDEMRKSTITALTLIRNTVPDPAEQAADAAEVMDVFFKFCTVVYGCSKDNDFDCLCGILYDCSVKTDELFGDNREAAVCLVRPMALLFRLRTCSSVPFSSRKNPTPDECLALVRKYDPEFADTLSGFVARQQSNLKQAEKSMALYNQNKSSSLLNIYGLLLIVIGGDLILVGLINCTGTREVSALGVFGGLLLFLGIGLYALHRSNTNNEAQLLKAAEDAKKEVKRLWEDPDWNKYFS